MQSVYTVRQVNAYIKNMFTQDFMLNKVYVKGEVSNCKYHTSGHIYFSLKDESGQMSCVMFTGQRKGLGFQMKDGQQIVVLGSISVYERDGRYQLYANEIILDGAGLLYEKYETLKKELEEMGMFSEEYKQPIPFYAKKIGIVTAPTGAAIRDIMNIAGRRNPFVQLILYPALVQGDGAKESIIKGIRMLEEKRVDIIIVGRGGGSIEDLWAFNEAEVARAVFNCTVPVISAVGHETDTTITDYVADLRVPTPSAAAELAVWDYQTAAIKAESAGTSLRRQLLEKLQMEKKKAEQYGLRLSILHPANKLRDHKMRMADLEERFQGLMEQRMKEARHRLQIGIEILKGLSPLEKLNQGYSYVQKESGQVVKSVEDVKEGQMLTIYVTDGKVQTEVLGIEKEAAYGQSK